MQWLKKEGWLRSSFIHFCTCICNSEFRKTLLLNHQSLLNSIVSGQKSRLFLSSGNNSLLLFSSLFEQLPSLFEALLILFEQLPSLFEQLPSLFEALPSLFEVLPSLFEALTSLFEALPSLFEVKHRFYSTKLGN